MAKSSVPTADQVQKYSALVLHEGLDDMALAPLVGGESACIRRFDDLKAGGGTVRVPLRRNLVGRGVVGDADVEGQEEAIRLLYFNQPVQVRRQSVKIDDPLTGQISQVDLLKETRPAIRDWISQVSDYDLMLAVSCLSNSELGWTTDGTNYYSPKSTRRVIGGQTVGDADTAVVIETGLTDATLDSTTGNLFGPEIIDLMVRKMQMANIAPSKVGGKEVYVCIAHPYQIKSLKQCYSWIQAGLHADTRGPSNINFSGKAGTRMVGLWHDCLIIQSNMIHTRLGAGGTAATEYFESADVVYNGTTAARAVFMGRGAGCLAWAKYPWIIQGKYDNDTKDVVTGAIAYGPGQVSFATNSGAQEAFASMTLDTLVVVD